MFEQSGVGAKRETIGHAKPDPEHFLGGFKPSGLNFIRPVHAGLITAPNTPRIPPKTSIAVLRQSNKTRFQGIRSNGLSCRNRHAHRADTYRLLFRFPGGILRSGKRTPYISSRIHITATQSEFVYFHELTHALQDQNLGLDFTIFHLGIHILIATFISDKNRLSRVTRSLPLFTYIYNTYFFASPRTPYANADTLSKIYRFDFLTGTDSMFSPVFLDVKGQLPYELGTNYVASLYSASKWNAVNSIIQYQPFQGQAPRSIRAAHSRLSTSIFTRFKIYW